MYFSLVATCLLFVLITLKIHSDAGTGAKVASGELVQEDKGRTNHAGGESVTHWSGKRFNPANGEHLVYKNDKPEVKLHVHEFPTTITSNTSAFRITTDVSGKMGNQMFQYASLMGIAAMNRMLPFYRSPQLQSSFMITYFQDWSFKGFHGVDEQYFATYDPTFEHLPQENTLIMQYFQSWKYFRHIGDIIRKEFTFKEHVRIAAQQIVSRHSMKIRNRTRVGVHVRRGDMNLVSLKKKGYHMAPGSYLRKAMDYMRQKHPDAIFITVTDDVPWCRKNVDASDVVYADWASAQIHLAALASCDHVIMTVGTYGWWGGYLSGGEVVYYWDRKELLHEPPLPVEIKHPEDFFPPEWIPLSGV
ncbi:hypothetical protein ACOMHN_048022 [Nucella lapillus]